MDENATANTSCHNCGSAHGTQLGGYAVDSPLYGQWECHACGKLTPSTQEQRPATTSASTTTADKPDYDIVHTAYRAPYKRAEQEVSPYIITAAMAFIVVVIAIITIGNAETDTDTAAPMAWASLGTFVFWAGLAIALWRWPVEYRRPK